MRLTMIDEQGTVRKPTAKQMRAVAEKIRESSCSSQSTCSVSRCMTGYWTDGYEKEMFFGDDIEDYRDGAETTVFRFCPICGKSLTPNVNLHLTKTAGDNMEDSE